MNEATRTTRCTRSGDSAVTSGGRIELEDDLYGSLCFVNETPRNRPFTHAEKPFVDSICRWLSGALERRELERSERQFRAVFDDPTMLVGLLDPDGTLRQINETAFAYVDADRGSVVDAPFPETPWWADTPGKDVREWIDRAAAGEYVEYEAYLDGPDGRRRWVNGTFRPVTDDGDVVSIVVSARGITERVEREQELERYKQFTDDLLDAVDDVFYVLNEDGTLGRWNASHVDVSGYTDEEITEMHALDFFPEDERPRIADSIEEAFGTGRTRVEAEVLTADGERIPYEFVAVALEDLEENPILTGIARDITERVAKEREVRERCTLTPG